MNVWTIVMSQRLEDADNTRSMLISRFLMERGHSVTMWTSAFDHIRKCWRHAGRESYRDPSGLHVRFMFGGGYARNISPQRYIDHLRAAKDFRRRARGLPKPDLILANIPDHFTAYSAWRYAQEHRIPFVVDVRDKWPEVLCDHIKIPAFRLLAKSALTYDVWKARQALGGATAIIAMMESFAEWASKEAGRARRDTDRVFYLNTAERCFGIELAPLPSESSAASALNQAGDRFVIAFTGTFNRSQHPNLLLDAVDIISNERLASSEEFAVIIGGGGLNQAFVEERCRAHSNVYYAGWLNRNEINRIVARADVGVVPFMVRTEALNNKIFAYLSGGTPLLSSASGDVFELIKTRGIGIDFEAGDARSLANAIVRLLRNRDLHERLATNAREFFVEALDRDRTYHEYADLLERLANNTRGDFAASEQENILTP